MSITTNKQKKIHYLINRVRRNTMNERIIWSYWFITVVSVAIAMFIMPSAIYLAIGITAIHTLHFQLKQPGITAFPIQVRISYIGLLSLGLIPEFSWIYWILLIGGSVKLITSYCPLARLVSLMPWNRTQSMSWRLLKRVILTPTISGSAIQLVK
jgi:hypothetical protein